MKIWGRRSSSNVQRVLFLCAEIGLAPEIREVGGALGGLDDPDFLRLTPTHRIPVLEDAGMVVWESHAILRYLASRYGVEFYGGDAAARAPIDSWLDWASGTLWPPIRTLYQQGHAMNLPLTDGKLRATRDDLIKALALLDRELRQRAFVAGPVFSIADVTLTVSLNRLLGMDADHALPEAVENWLWRVTDRGAFAAIKAAEAPELARWRQIRPHP